MTNKLGLNKLNQIMTVADKILVLIILIMSLLLIFFAPQLVAEETSKSQEVVVNLDNKELVRYPLTNNKQLKKIKFDFVFEGEDYQGTLQMKEGKVRLERLSKDISPLPIHAQMGWISQPHQMIVSMPVKLTVTIEGEQNKKQDVDLRTF
ncbi:hypothetical protein JCM16358_06710 [Halanaerocella petrolearia]